MKTDQAFRDKVAGAGDDTARLQVIIAAGFTVTAEDRETILDALTPAKGELSDAQLEGVSGAGSFTADGSYTVKKDACGVTVGPTNPTAD